jgi:hypothetical protein
VVAAMAILFTNSDKIIAIIDKWTNAPKEAKTEIVITKEALIPSNSSFLTFRVKYYSMRKGIFDFLDALL